LRVTETACAPSTLLQAHTGAAERRLAFCSNDYLGLAAHPAIVDALIEGARRWGAGSGASHLVSGHSRAHALLEDRLGALFASHIPDACALLFCSGFAANLALLTTLGDGDATILADKLNHASLVDGGLLAAARMHRYPHGRLDLLAARLAECTSTVKLIVTDSVFSMDGDLAPIPELLALAEAHDAWLIIDDAHGFGVLGAGGRGAVEHFGLAGERLIVMGTLGKAAGVSGAFVVAHPAVIDALIQGGRSYIYTTAMPPALAHALSASLTLIDSPEGAARRATLRTLIAHLRRGLLAVIDAHRPAGWHLGESATAIQPLIVGDNQAALAMAAELEQHGLWVPAIRPPTVATGSARLRISLSAAHTVADVERLCAALAQLAAGATARSARA